MLNDSWDVDDSDPLAPARGCLVGIFAGFVLLAVTAFVIMAVLAVVL